MIDILRDIGEIVKDDKEHFVKVEVSWTGVNVYLEYDPMKDFNENVIIPIELDLTMDFCYIPDDKYREMFNPNDYGIGLEEIILIKNIMQYLEDNVEEIREICNMYDFETKDVE